MLWDDMAQIPDPTSPAPDACARADSPRRRRMLIVALWFIALGLGGVHAWSARHAMDPDGISYLDIADAWLGGDWANVVNGYWSPLYSWLLAAGLFIFKPSAYWEATVVHLVNFVIYACALACFHFFWSGLIRYHRTGRPGTCPEDTTRLARRLGVC